MPQSQRSPSSTASRREFLKTSAVGMATASGLPLARSAHAAGSEAIKIGMLGCGGRCSGAAAQALSLGKDVKLAGMNDVFEKRMRGRKEYFKTRFPDQFIATDETCTYGLEGYKKVIEASDAVLIACASKYHPFYAEEAVKAGKHVFVEKPHAIDPAGCRQLKRLCELAKQKNVSVVSGHESRYSPAYAEMVQRIHDGAIGNIVSIQSMFLRAAYQTVARDPSLNETEYQFSNWYHFRWLSGDDVTQSLVHNLDRLRWALREENPTWCFGLAGRSTSFGEVYGDMFDHHTVVYEFTSGVRLYALCQTRANCHSVWDDIIMGSKGVCYWADCRIEGETKWRYEGPHAPPSGIEEQQILIGAIRDGRVVNHGDTMIDSTYVAVMGQLACYCGKPVTWDQMMAADFEFEPKLADVRLDMDAPTKPDASGNYPLPVPGVTKYF
ncbi:MAG TPA: Gfo/Idh/MocA family oxidoreductase [Candidatus Anammoximicrobium sp.]|nr:Gfo/Idh/MocA family oxidoreductase [Candidatus Anammoximicrobium sp.]